MPHPLLTTIAYVELIQSGIGVEGKREVELGERKRKVELGEGKRKKSIPFSFPTTPHHHTGSVQDPQDDGGRWVKG
ncbi:hypothetical protein, partial [Igneacidithiobacillus copahuensis]|uniref:hypothetical protein n=1 Tax=Igneacidithiobacillus copahuensis TaxID=2724909 RepID=UPI001C0670BC